ncbi:MAG: hypothetical protein JHC93_05815 [Parachlamydiales bacterium]|nr:hypothetical protein [Parachlamydiales bacterium]
MSINTDYKHPNELERLQALLPPEIVEKVNSRLNELGRGFKDLTPDQRSILTHKVNDLRMELYRDISKFQTCPCTIGKAVEFSLKTVEKINSLEQTISNQVKTFKKDSEIKKHAEEFKQKVENSSLTPQFFYF